MQVGVSFSLFLFDTKVDALRVPSPEWLLTAWVVQLVIVLAAFKDHSMALALSTLIFLAELSTPAKLVYLWPLK